MALQELLMNEEDIRMLNNDFNYKNYGFYYEQLEKEKVKDDEAEPQNKAASSGFEKLISENNILNQMWNRVQLEPVMTQNYEQWLEDEVWTYFD